MKYSCPYISRVADWASRLQLVSTRNGFQNKGYYLQRDAVPPKVMQSMELIGDDRCQGHYAAAILQSIVSLAFYTS